MDDIELSMKFGEAIKPRYNSEAEEKVRPCSAHVLDENSSSVLGNYIEISQSNNFLMKLVVGSGFMLWLVSENGEIHFSFEEVVNPKNGSFLYIRQRADKSPPYGNKLGHPALVGAKPARIGGEIYYDEDLEGWMITNQSGRYGYNRPHTYDLLQNVANVFASHGIELKPFAV